jgi:hypothetical protein
MAGIRKISVLPASGDVPAAISGYLTLLLFTILLFINQPAISQETQDYNEIAVYLEIPKVGGGEINAVISGEELFLPITDLYDFLKIKNIPSRGLDSITGYFINQQARYIISRKSNSISYQGKTYNLEPGDLIRTETNLFLRSKFFGKIFGLDCSFNYRSLSVIINSSLELPLIREMKLEAMRKNLNRLKGDVKSDTTIERSHPLFKTGTADWSAISTEVINGNTDTRLNLTLGSMIAGGEATASLNYNSMVPLGEKQQYYQWRYVNNEFKPLRQIVAGKIVSHATSSIYDPVIGVQFTNTPTTYRRSFGSYTLSDKTEPGWIVELYVNSNLVDYVKADASGFYTFEIPLVYGNSTVQLKFYSPWGEERTRELNINIPFNFLPVKTMEYNVSAGIVEDTAFSKYSKASFNYGLTRNITIGAGAEYLSSVFGQPVMPYINASFRILNNLLISGEYTQGVQAKGTLSYRLPSNMQLDLNYTWYDKNQKAIKYNYREERKAVLSTPLKIGKFLSYQRLSYYEVLFPTYKFTTTEWMFSGSVLGVNTNLTTDALFSDKSSPYIYSNLALSVRLPAKFVIMPQLQYGFSKGKFLSAKVGIEKHILKHAYMNFSYEQIFTNNVNMAELGFRYDFSFAQTGASARVYNNKPSLTQYARGSLISDKETKYLKADNRTNVGRGGITIVPYLDINGNGRRDSREPKASGLNLHASSGSIEKRDIDTTIRIISLEPYTNCFIELETNSFENVAWRIKNRTLNISVDPNIMKLVEVPVTVVGEASGIVSLDKNGEITGIERIVVNIYSQDKRFITKMLTEEGGYFSNFGLKPGSYIIAVDSLQLKKLGFISTPESGNFTIKPTLTGDFVDTLNFTLSKEVPETIAGSVKEKTNVPVNNISAESVQNVRTTEKAVVKKDTTYMVIHQVTQQLVTVAEDSYALQLGAFKMKPNADKLRKQLQNLLGKNAEIVTEGDFFKVRISGLKDMKEVDQNIAILRQNGVIEVWLISMQGRKQQWINVSKKDSVSTITETTIEKPVDTFTPNITIQVGAFKQGQKAIDLKRRLSATTNKNVEIAREDGFFKVRISGFTSMKEMDKVTKGMGLIGAGKVWTLPDKKQNETITLLENPVIEQQPEAKVEEKAEVKPEEKVEAKLEEKAEVKPEEKVEPKVEAKVEEKAEVKPEEKVEAKVEEKVEPIAEVKVEEKPVENPVEKVVEKQEEKPAEPIIAEVKQEMPAPSEKAAPPEPKISLQVGVVYKKSEAQKVQRKIASKLKLNAEIVKQWDYYRVVIPGFYTREETYKYYPELVGIGFNKIYMIEKK